MGRLSCCNAPKSGMWKTKRQPEFVPAAAFFFAGVAAMTTCASDCCNAAAREIPVVWGWPLAQYYFVGGTFLVESRLSLMVKEML